MVTGASRTRHKALMTQNIKDDSDDDYEGPMRTPTGSLDANQLLTATQKMPGQIQSSSANKKLIQMHVPNFRGHKNKFKQG